MPQYTANLTTSADSANVADETHPGTESIGPATLICRKTASSPWTLSRDAGFRFPVTDANLVNGVTIDAVTLGIVITGSTNRHMNAVIKGHDVDATDVFATGSCPHDLAVGANLTTASLAWNESSMTPFDDAQYKYKTGLAAIVQEIVDRPGWTGAGRAIKIIVYTLQDGTTAKRCDFRGHTAAKYPTLDVIYTTAGGSVRKGTPFSGPVFHGGVVR
jgi:hypothetical protein